MKPPQKISTFERKIYLFWQYEFLNLKVAVRSCSAGSSLSNTGSNFLKRYSCFCSSLHRLTSRWPHLAQPAHVSIHLHKDRRSLACQSGFIGQQIKQAIICYQHAVPGRSGTILERLCREMSRQQLLHEESCGSLRWNQVLAKSSLACRSRGSMVKGKKIPLLYFRGLYPWGKTRQKHARNSTAFIPTKVKLSLILNTLQLKQKTDSSCSLMEPWKNRKSHVQIWQGHATYQRASPQEERGQSVRPPCSESCYCSVAPKVL